MKILFLLTLIPVLVSSCRNKTIKESSSASFDVFAEKVTQMNLKAENFEEVTDFFKLAGADYIPGITNDPYRSEKYLNNVVIAAANMGVYLADGLYQLAYNECSSGYLSIKAAKDIANYLDMGAVFDDLMMDRYRDTVVYADSVLSVIGRCIAESELFLNNEDRMQVFTGFIGGNYIEKLYLLFHVIHNLKGVESNEEMVLTLRQLLLTTEVFLQKLPEVILLVESVKRETDSGVILNPLKEIETLRQQLIIEDEPGKFTPSSIFENKVWLEVFSKVKEVRELLVNVPVLQ